MFPLAADMVMRDKDIRKMPMVLLIVICGMALSLIHIFPASREALDKWNFADYTDSKTGEVTYSAKRCV